MKCTSRSGDLFEIVGENETRVKQSTREFIAIRFEEGRYLLKNPRSCDSVPASRLYAVVPAAGLSRRMGRPKLLLPIGHDTVIGRLLKVLQAGSVFETVVVLRKADDALRHAVVAGNARPIQPDVDPPDMRTSVAYALEDLERRETPHDPDGWLLIPADHPLLDSEVFENLLDRWQTGRDEILIPVHEGKRGHPTFFRWSLARRLGDIPADQGLNWLVRQPDVNVTEFPVASPAVLMDLDTPADYARLLDREGK